MKPKYYPHITILGAATITVAPLCFVLSLPYMRSASEFDAVIAGESHSLKRNGSLSPVQDDLSLAMASANSATTSPVAESNTPTRVAMLPATSHQASTLATPPVARAPIVGESHGTVAPTIPPANDPSIRRPPMPSPVVQTSRPGDVVPIPVAVNVSPDGEQAEQSVVVEDPARAEERNALDAEMNKALTAKTASGASSYFDSTGHLAMTRPQGGAIAGTRLPPSPVQKRARNTGDPANATLDTTRDRKTDTPVRKPSFGSASMEANIAAGTWPPEDDGFGKTVEEVIEDVILQHPLESRRVNRVESVVAVTRAKGWPIALVRSDLPDDHWWVQQMVGIRGNAFAARVNFGNDESLPGSVYHMVIVFLDSPDEVRRFRIAKRFKELPEGSRRSREFTFARQ